MKIVVFVNYSDENFNKDFTLSNALLDRGHQVFLVSSVEQLNQYISNDLDKLIRGFSASNVDINCDFYDANGHEIDEVVDGK